MAIGYLEPDFDPNFLTVSQLKKILTRHEIDFNPDHSKRELVKLFQRHIGRQASSSQKASFQPLIEVKRSTISMDSRGTPQSYDSFSSENFFQIKKEESVSPIFQRKPSNQSAEQTGPSDAKRETTRSRFASIKPPRFSKSPSPTASIFEDSGNQERIGPIVYPQIPVLRAKQRDLPRQKVYKPRCIPVSFFGKLFFTFISVWAIWYRIKVSFLGFCETNELSKSSLDSRFDIFFPRCLKCPMNAICQDGEFKGCQEGFLEKRNPFSTALFPFSKKCVLDTSRIKKLEIMTEDAISLLQYQLGNHQCWDGKVPKGLTVVELYKSLFDSAKPELRRSGFGELFENMTHVLIAKTDQVDFFTKKGETISESVVFALEPRFNRLCKAKLLSKVYIKKYKNELLMGAVILAALQFIKSLIMGFYRETQLVKRCVAKVLDMLIEREHLHITRPLVYPESTISAIHARDVLLAEAYPNLSARNRVWSRVENQILTNSNVRSSQGIYRGDVHPLWEWIGDAKHNPRFDSKPLQAHASSSGSSIHSHDDEGNNSI